MIVNHSVIEAEKVKIPKIKLGRIFSYIIMVGICLIVFIPLIVVFFASFKSAAQVGSEFVLKLPDFKYLQNYMEVFKSDYFVIGFKNTFILVVTCVLINAILGSMTAFAINRFDFKLKKVLMALYVIGMLLPMNITEISRFTIIHKMGAYNTLFAPMIIYIASDLLQLYIYIQFLEKISTSLDESALIDGCSYFGVFTKIIFPLLLPATATLSILKAMDIMNDMFIPYLYMPSEKLKTMTTMLMLFSNSQFGSWEKLSAAIIVVMIPTVAIYLSFQKYIFKGIVAGAVKE